MTREEVLEERLAQIREIIDVVQEDIDATSYMQLLLALEWEPGNDDDLAP